MLLGLGLGPCSLASSLVITAQGGGTEVIPFLTGTCCCWGSSSASAPCLSVHDSQTSQHKWHCAWSFTDNTQFIPWVFHNMFVFDMSGRSLWWR
jgi:hypothetical protein